MDPDTEVRTLLREIMNLRSRLSDSRTNEFDVTIANKVESRNIEQLASVSTLSSVYTLKAHSGRIHSICWSADDSILMSVGADSFLCLWDVRSGLIKNLIDTTLTQATCADANSTLNAIYCGGLYATVEAYTLSHRAPEDGYSEYSPTTLFEHGGRINSINCIGDTRLLTSACADGAVLWDISEVMQINKFPHTTDVNCTLPMSPGGDSFVSGSADGIPRLWDVRLPNPLVCIMSGHESELTCMQRLPNETSFVTGSDDTEMHLYDIRIDCPIGRYFKNDKPVGMKRNSQKRGSSLSMDGGDEGVARHTDTRTTGPLGDDDSAGRATQGITGLGVSTSGRIVLTGCRDSTVCIWDLCNEASPALVHQEQGPIMDLKMANEKFAMALLTWDEKTKLQIMLPQ